MRILLMVVLVSAWAVAGCGRQGASVAPPAGRSGPAAAEYTPLPAFPEQKLIVTPDNALVGKVVRVNPGGRYVVLNFPVGRLPALQQRLHVYRLGLKVGEVTISGPHRDDNIIADVTGGDAAVGDEVRDR